MDEIRIRPARESEQKSLEALQWRASLGNPGDREALLAHPDAIELPIEQIRNGQVFVAETGDLVLGFAAILLREDGNVELDGLFVEPELWRRGIGRKLIDHCVKESRSLGASAIHVIGHPDAEGFYKTCGFELLGTTETRFGPALLLRRLL
jgi:N-acetylglutamate synthase-like GNAT family acetyltransferase